MVDLSRDFHAELLIRKWAIYHELILEEETLTAVRPVNRRYNDQQKRPYLSDARFEAMGGFCIENKFFGDTIYRFSRLQKLKGKRVFRRPIPSLSTC